MIKFLFRLIINLIKFTCISIPLQLIGSLVLLPTLYFFPKIKRLPTCLKWFDGADQYVGRNTEVYDKIMDSDFWTKYTWLAWRNPINYFSYTYLGFYLKNPYVVTFLSKNPNVYSEIGDATNKVAGLYRIEITLQDKIYYEYYYIFVYKSIFKLYSLSQPKCIRFRMGWKIGEDPFFKDEHVQEVFVISPFHKFDGIN
jgi:hypothetical protein